MMVVQVEIMVAVQAEIQVRGGLVLLLLLLLLLLVEAVLEVVVLLLEHMGLLLRFLLRRFLLLPRNLWRGPTSCGFAEYCSRKWFVNVDVW